MIMVMVAVVVVVIVIIIVVIMVVVADADGVGAVVASVGLILRDASRTKWDLSFGLLPVTNAFDLSRVVVVTGITALGDTNNITADAPAAVWNVVVVQLRGNGDVAGQHEATECEKLLSTHDC